MMRIVKPFCAFFLRKAKMCVRCRHFIVFCPRTVSLLKIPLYFPDGKPCYVLVFPEKGIAYMVLHVAACLIHYICIY